MQILRIVKKYLKILSSHQKLRIFELGVLMVIGGFLEMLSVSLMLPFMNAVMEPEATMENRYVRQFCSIFDIHSATTFLVTLSFVLAIIYILKNVYLILETNIQYRFVYGNMFSLKSQLLDAFLHRQYEYYLGVDSGEVIRIVNQDTDQAFNLLTTLLTLFTEMVVSVTLIGTVFFITPVITCWIAAILLVLLLIINALLKPALRKAGLDYQNSAANMYKWLLQSIQGIKEIIVMHKEEYFKENFDRYGAISVNASRKNGVLGTIPRFMIEAISLSVMFIVVGILIYSGEPIEEMIPVLTAAAMASLRLLPSVNRMSNAMSNISYSEPMLDKLIENLRIIQGNDDVSLAHLKVTEQTDTAGHRTIQQMCVGLQLRGITYHYPQGKGDVLSGADLTIRPGESVGLVGASGAGKTTAVDIILGLLHPQGGAVCVDGIDINEDMEGWLSQIGYIPQMIFMLDDTIRANIAFGIPPDDISDDEVWRALSDASLAEFVRELPDGLDTEIGERGVRLSGGQRQRIGIARALYLDPTVLIFDEATSALDNETEKAIMDSINSLHGKKTMIIIAHRLTTIEQCDHIYRVKDGKIQKER